MSDVKDSFDISTQMEKGYSEPYNHIKIALCKNGSMFFSQQDGEGFIYLYPDQIKELEKILRQRRKQSNESRLKKTLK
jgi:hypothetical protein